MHLQSKYTMNKTQYALAILLLLSFELFGEITRKELDLSGLTWRVWMDETAKWQDDTLYLPSQVDLKKISSNPPTIGWDSVYQTGAESSLPVIVEELFSGGNSSWTYHGVSWFTTQVDVPEGWDGKVVRLYVGKKNLRIEIYINEKLAGYDIVAGTPYTCDISEFLIPGETNRIAFRITNPGGQRGWNDFPLIRWGGVELPPGRDFGGIGGDVKLLVTNKVFIDDIFIKNLLPAKANNIEVQATITNHTDNTLPAAMTIRIASDKDYKVVFEKQLNILIEKGTQTTLRETFQVPEAELWDVDHPNLYRCEVIIGTENERDQFHQRFGFRVFEVRANEKGEENFYLNGKRFRHKSAIDWGYYAHHGYYPDEEMVRKSVEAARAIGNNGITCHRNMCDPLLLKYADELGLVIFEEPGGFDASIILYNQVDYQIIHTFEGQVMQERCLRMARRDRNHPSVVAYILANERDVFDLLRKNVMIDMHNIDNSKLIVNQSGGHPGGPSGHIPHLRPYDTKFRLDYMGDHTVWSESRFMEYDLNSHLSAIDTAKYGVYGRIDPLLSDNIIYWGEVRCYAGPDNWYLINQQSKTLPEGRTGYEINSFRPLAEKIEAYFNQNNLAQTGSRNILSPADVTVQAGRGLMYINGRLSQVIKSNNSADGFAINGWSGGSSGIPEEHGEIMEWYSAIVDVGRNLKGPADDYLFWNRPLQVAISRQNGKYFKPGDEIKVSMSLINEGLLPPGNYQLEIRVKDGDGNYTGHRETIPLLVEGKDTFAQTISEEYIIHAKPEWKAGYITIEGLVTQNGEVMATGHEQFLLKNRASFIEDLRVIRASVYKWEKAEAALREAGYRRSRSGAEVILAGEVPPDNQLNDFLRSTENGATLILKFGPEWADALFRKGILSEEVTQWGGEQIPYWIGNGWGYIDHFIGNQAVPGVSTIGTNGWEVPDNPYGFYPFVSNYPQKAYGGWFARPDVVLVLLGEIEFGKGKIILAPSYQVDDDNAFNDMLFFNMITLSAKNSSY
jgi:beta-galactosidase